MPTYVTLEAWTDQGIRKFRESQRRAESSSALMATLGVTMRDVYWTMGPYDLVTVIDAPDDETASAVLLADAERGNVRTTTMRAFDAVEMTRIVERLS